MRAALILLAFLALNMLAAVAVVQVKHESREMRGDLQALRVERDRLNTEWAQLQLEESAWANPDRIGRLAKQRLNMVQPRAYTVLEVGQ